MDFRTVLKWANFTGCLRLERSNRDKERDPWREEFLRQSIPSNWNSFSFFFIYLGKWRNDRLIEAKYFYGGNIFCRGWRENLNFENKFEYLAQLEREGKFLVVVIRFLFSHSSTENRQVFLSCAMHVHNVCIKEHIYRMIRVSHANTREKGREKEKIWRSFAGIPKVQWHCRGTRGSIGLFWKLVFTA